MEDIADLNELTTRNFIERCRFKLSWGDLSDDVIMDVGCGEQGYCGKAILEKFPEVGAVICIDCNAKVLRNFRQKNTTRIQCVVADIEKRDSLRHYEGRMTKVISTHVFHQLMEKEVAFRNVYHLLKPGGEAAILFVIKSVIYEWLTELLKNQKWKNAYQGYYVEDLYKDGYGADYYKEILGNMKFQVIESLEEERVIPYPTDQDCKEALYQMCGNNFKVPSELLEEFKEECLQVLLKCSARDKEGRPCYRSTELSLLLVKPKEGPGSETKENSVS